MTVDELFTTYWPVILFILGLIGAVCWGAFKATWWAGRTDIRIDRIEEDVKGIKGEITEIKTDIVGIKNDITEIRGEITGIKTVLNDLLDLKELVSTALGISTPKEISNAKSPVQLNDYGDEISDAINGKELVKNHLNAVDTSAGMSEYQIQQACLNYAQTHFMKKISKQQRDVLEGVAYKEGILIQVVLRVVGLELRNAKFAELGMSITGDEKSLEPQE